MIFICFLFLTIPALLAVTLAAENKTETKDKRHTVRTRVATSPIGLANQRIGYDQGSNQQQYHVQPTASGQSSEGEEVSTLIGSKKWLRCLS